MKDKDDLPTEEDLIAVWEWLNTLPPKEAEKLRASSKRRLTAASTSENDP